MTTPDSATSLPTFALSDEQIRFFDLFGFVHLPDVFTAEIDRIAAGFDEAYEDAEKIELDERDRLHSTDDPHYANNKRSIVGGFVERSEKLGWLRNERRLLDPVESLLGPDYEFVGSDGNHFNCDVLFHTDTQVDMGAAMAPKQRHLKCFFYLDERTAETGALRLFPGTHRLDGSYGSTFANLSFNPPSVEAELGRPQNELPAACVETKPGDVLINDFRTIHGSFGGGPHRRVMTLNFREPAPE